VGKAAAALMPLGYRYSSLREGIGQVDLRYHSGIESSADCPDTRFDRSRSAEVNGIIMLDKARSEGRGRE
jgi:hypothetical protein